MNPRPTPPSLGVAWKNLLTQRKFLYELLRQFEGRDDFIARSQSDRLEDRKDVAALERFAETVFNVYIDVAIELLVARAPAEGSEIKKLKAEPILSELRRARVLDADLWQRLDDVREGRNTLLQHGSSFAPIAAVWLTIEQTNRSIDKAIETTQRGFGELGIRLDVEFS